ncbi:Asp-tRNA(Asn)/Glu-tRNA(Gln) amidotransferase subunit GatC [Youxingia wuxianensis]|uniref:Aspartyl/glutamyl-tRNA amidotransferase subunit C n=1 Tax=Youxingia wuxianensis TaxID=2763678 RepID=A0A926EQM5_9FIRM|nr:Asp-tRNA(Asn)/Glu-tRNA(Gln) amidotransferase subunit GatC [Youxingia wuxianensis]MBC8584749.1 aspartyl/glutamyl-tRNA amidotransferase subunit C [Youxingia wuxianensis]
MVTRDEIMEIALLSKLYVPQEELDQLTEDMANIIAFADTINTAGSDTQEFDNINHLSNVFREDAVVPSYERELILKNVDGGENGYFPVKKRG